MTANVEIQIMKRFSAFWLVAVLAFSSPYFLLAQGNPGENKFASAGISAAKRKDWNAAVSNFRKAVEAEPNDKKNSRNLALALQQRGIADVGQKKYDQAIADLSEALKINPADLPAHRFRAFAYLSKSDWKNALQEYDIVVKEAHNDAEAFDRRAFVELQLKDYDKALADYSAAIKQRPDEVRFYVSRAHILELKGQTAQAIADCDKVLQLQPGNAEAQARKARLQGTPSQSPPSPSTASSPAATKAP